MKRLASLILILASAVAFGQNQNATKDLTLNGVSSLSVTTASLPVFVVGRAYSATLAASGGTAPYTWSITKGALPAGLSLNPSTGVISGTATALCAANPCQITVQVTDSSGTLATIKLQWNASTTKTVASYNLYRGTTDGGPYPTKVATTDSKTLVASETVPRVSSTLYYVVEAVDAQGLKSVFSNQAKAVIQ